MTYLPRLEDKLSAVLGMLHTISIKKAVNVVSFFFRCMERGKRIQLSNVTLKSDLPTGNRILSIEEMVVTSGEKTKVEFWELLW